MLLVSRQPKPKLIEVTLAGFSYLLCPQISYPELISTVRASVTDTYDLLNKRQDDFKTGIGRGM